MLTVFTVPKPFDGLVATIQRNALRSWLDLPDCRVIICGDEPGAREVARAFGIEQIRDVATNEFGTPLLSSVFPLAEERATHDLLCYANADIIFLPGLVTAAARVASELTRFVLVGEAWNLEVTEEISLTDGWDQRLARRAVKEGRVRPPWSIDFFVYPRGTLTEMPPFAVGRPAWDNWMIYQARRRRVPVVDVSGATTVIHQMHDYRHVKQRREYLWDGPEADANRAILGSEARLLSIADASHRLTPEGLANVSHHIVQRLRIELVSAPGGDVIVDALMLADRKARTTLRQARTFVRRAVRHVRARWPASVTSSRRP